MAHVSATIADLRKYLQKESSRRELIFPFRFCFFNPIKVIHELLALVILRKQLLFGKSFRYRREDYEKSSVIDDIHELLALVVLRKQLLFGKSSYRREDYEKSSVIDDIHELLALVVHRKQLLFGKSSYRRNGYEKLCHYQIREDFETLPFFRYCIVFGADHVDEALLVSLVCQEMFLLHYDLHIFIKRHLMQVVAPHPLPDSCRWNIGYDHTPSFSMIHVPALIVVCCTIIEMCFIGFLVPENVCLALKIKPLSHLEVEILGNINLWRPFWIFRSGLSY
ncbi:hypothetical protein GQR58_009520 [Nymphon striatum]|nr:hypothetical protein GQR58_009520 [Nymphon striatum]